MFKTILLCTDGSVAADQAVGYAIHVARKLSARMLVLHVTDIRSLEGPWLADLSGALGAQPYPALLQQVREIQDTRAAAILEGVVKKCREGGVDCEVAHETGMLSRILVEYEERASLVVLGQKGEHAKWQQDSLGSSVERLVRVSKKPCLVVTAEAREPRRLLIAHDGSDESLRALERGLDFAVALDAAVTVVTACEKEKEEAAGKVLQHAVELATARGVEAQSQLLVETPEKAILQAAVEAKADLIVMGAYGHTRIREWILGSTTSHVLHKATVPVLLARG